MNSIHLTPLLATLTAFGITGAAAHAASVTGPSSSSSPYFELAPGFQANSTIYSLLTVGDAVPNTLSGAAYRMVGIPDGLGAYDNGNGTFTLLMNHELGATAGVARAHGATGAFVSEWVINKSTLSVLSGQDLIQNVATWNGASFNAPASGVALGRLCSADLADVSAFYNAASGFGTQSRLFLSGEEVGAEGRAFAHVATGANKGTSYQLPGLGRLSYENAVANPGTGNTTAILSTDDATPGQLYLYLGDKTNTGTEVEKAGLTNGSLYGIRVNGAVAESRATGIDALADNRDLGTFSLASLGNATNLTGASLQSLSTGLGVTEFLRPEDAHWNPLDPTELFFVTTDRFSTLKDGPGTQDGRSRLWKLKFSDLSNFSLGGNIEMLLEGGTGPLGNAGQMFDNITVDGFGNIMIQEDPGNTSYLSKIWQYNIASGQLSQVAQHSPAFFLSGMPGFLTQDEESSGIIDISGIMGGTNGDRWYIFDTQAHYGIAGELVEGGQLQLMRISQTPVPEPSTYALCGAALLVGLIVSRRRKQARAS